MAQFGVYVSGGSESGGNVPATSLGTACGCRGCQGRVGVVMTHVVGSTRVRYLACKSCGWRPAQAKQLIPLEFSPRRAPKE